MKISGNEVKTIEILEKNKLQEILYNNLEFSKKIVDYINDNTWISIPNKNLYFNKKIMGCYPNFKEKFQNMQYAVSKNCEENLKMIKENLEYSQNGIEWDIQTVNESKMSFCQKNHPLQSSNDEYHPICGSKYFACKNSSEEVRSYLNYNNYEVMDELPGLLIPIFRVGRKEDHESFNTKNTPFNYSPETIIIILALKDLMPDFGSEELKNEYYKINDRIQSLIKKCTKYANSIIINENKKIIISDFDLNKVGKEIFYGDKERIFGKNKIKFTLKNSDVVEVDFDFGAIKKVEYIYANGDKELCSCKRDKNGDFIKVEKAVLIKLNGDKEVRNYVDGILNGKSGYIYKNNDKEIRDYIDGVLNGKSEYIYANGDKEIRNYVDGKLQGEGIFYLANGEEGKRFSYENNEKKDVTPVYGLLNVDKIRVNLSSYDENILTDPNRGHWDLFGMEDISVIEVGIGKKVYRRDPQKDIKPGGIVGIDFGTKNTVVVFQDDNNITLPMRISGNNLYLDVAETDYENPTVIEFRDINRFMENYREKIGRPSTRWEDVTVSQTAFHNMITGGSDEFTSTISDLKQWAGNENEKIVVRDKNGVETVFPGYIELKDGDIDPIELYAYYIGSYINNMRNGIYMEYFLSFPVTYAKKIREKILNSFERGLKKSLPESILEDDTIMKKFKVRHGANEPAAYAICALQQYRFEPDEGEAVYYGVFDFGGGTADFDFGIWKLADDERSFDYKLVHFGAGGDRYLGGENILKELSYTVLKEEANVKRLKKEKISFARPRWCRRFVGDEVVVDESPEAKLNIRVLMEKLRPIWEKSEVENNNEPKLKVSLYNKSGKLKSGIELEIDQEELQKIIENKIERGIKNFFIAMKRAMKNEDVNKLNIFLAGNSCKHPKVMELFEKHRGDFEGEIEIFPALGTKEAYEKMKERNIQVNPLDKTNPTGKTGVAYGIIESRIGGRIDIENRDEKENIDNEINFKYYIGYESRKKLKVVLGPKTQYEQFIYYVNVTAEAFDLYYSSLPEAMESKMPITKAIRKRIQLKNRYSGAKVYIKSISPDTITYVVSIRDIIDKKYLEEGKIKLN